MAASACRADPSRAGDRAGNASTQHEGQGLRRGSGGRLRSRSFSPTGKDLRDCRASTRRSSRTLRGAVDNESDAVFIRRARVRSVEDGRVTFVRNGVTESVTAGRIVGADGRASTVRRSLGVSTGRITCSRMVGVTVTGVLPLEGYGYVVLGGPGPILMYQLGEDGVRIIMDVPLDQWIPRDRIGFLSDAYAGLLPETLRPAFVAALCAGRFETAANELRPRVTYGTPHRVLIGDAAGHYHPITASGMALGFGDALALAEAGDFGDFTRKRFRAIHTPELLAMELYEVFADHRPECAAVRRAVYRRWRASSSFRHRTMRLLACEETSPARLNLTGGAILAGAITREMPRSCDQAAWRRTCETVRALSIRVRWLLRGVRLLRKARKAGREDERILDALGRALPTSMSPGNALPMRSRGSGSLRCRAGPESRACAPPESPKGGWCLGRRDGLVPHAHRPVRVAAPPPWTAAHARPPSPRAAVLRTDPSRGRCLGFARTLRSPPVRLNAGLCGGETSRRRAG